MLVRTHVLRNLHSISKKALSSATQSPKVVEKQKSFLTKESNPTNHTKNHIGKVYIMPNNIIDSLKLTDCMELKLKKQFVSFGKLGIVIRKCAVEIMEYLAQTDYKNPINKYVIYGPEGAGKTLTLLHLLHYSYVKNYVILFANWPHEWLIFPKDFVLSPTHNNMYDLPFHAEKWLRLFKHQNQHLLGSLDLKTTKDYNWSGQDRIKSGIPLTELIDFGVNRIRYACNVVNALCEEIKIASTESKCKTIVIVDGFNVFFGKYTSVRDEKKIVVPPERITLTTAFLNMTKYDWCNGAAVLTVDKRVLKESVDSDLPGHLLGTDGFEHLDPFIPLKINNYTDEEFNNILDFYESRKWLKPIDSAGRAELKALSLGNATNVWKFSSRL